ncbi:MAG TPA: TonB-dependent receptor [Allosphingosinicella sp.]|nr:TonB-dependent receptor [Allosphingosinicella sp.]
MNHFIRNSGIALLVGSTLSGPAFAQGGAGGEPEIIVTARRNAEDPAVVAEARERLSRTPGAVSVVASETYEDRLAIGFPDLLRDVPSVLSNKRYGEESRLSIRGSGIDQSYHQRGVLIAQDGVPFADADGFSDFQKVDPLGARYIEVYTGGNALRFGGAQLGGAINLITPNGSTAESPFMVRAEAGSYDTYRGQAAASGRFGAFDAYGSINAIHAGGYRQNEEQESIRGTLNLGYRWGENEIRLIGYAADIDQQVPGTLTLAAALATPRQAGAGVIAGRWARDQDVQRITLQTRLRLTAGLTFEGGIYSTWTNIHHPIPIVIDQDIDTQGAFGRFDLAGELGGHRADLFFGAYYRTGKNNQGLFVNMGGLSGFQFGNSRQEASGLDLFAEGRFFLASRFALVAGGSYGRATRDYADRLAPANNAEKTFQWFSPRVGLLYEGAGGYQIYANVTRSVEPPHYGALVQAPVPQFVPVRSQRAWTAEVGTRGRSGAFTWDFAFYRSWIENELLSFNAATGYPATFFNAGDTTHQGIEASLDWRILDSRTSGRLRLRQTYTWSDFTFDGDPVYGDNRLPVVPQHQYRVSLRYDHPSGAWIEPFVDWRMKDIWVDYANTLRAPGYALLNVSAGFDLSNGLSLFVDARNLTGKNYVAEFGAITDATSAPTDVFYPGEGRSLFGGIRMRF